MKRTKFRWLLPLLLLALVFSLGVAACGDDDDDDDVEDAVDDAAEEVEDAADDVADEVEDTADDVADDVVLTGDAEAGQALFTELGCGGCHTVDTPDAGTGPSLMNVAEVADERVEGTSAEEYLRESIVNPSAHVVEGFEDVMPSFEEQLDDEGLDNLVAYLMTLDG